MTSILRFKDSIGNLDSTMQASILATYKPVVNLTSLVPYMQRVEEIMRDAESTFKKTRHLIIYYEDLVADPSRVRSFFSFPSSEPPIILALPFEIAFQKL